MYNRLVMKLIFTMIILIIIIIIIKTFIPQAYTKIQIQKMQKTKQIFNALWNKGNSQT